MINKKYVKIGLIIIIFLGIFLRVYNLDQESFDFDEIHTMNTLVKNDFKSAVKTIIQEEDLPTIDSLLLREWYKLVGDHHFLLRLFPVVFSILSILILFFLTKNIFNEHVALISSLLLSVSMVSISHAQTIRSYSAFTFFTLLSFYFFTRLNVFLSENKSINKAEVDHWRYNYLLFIIVTIISCYINYLAFFSIIIQNMIVLLNTKSFFQIPKKWVLSQLIIGLFCWPLLILSSIQLNNLHKLFQYVLFHKIGMPTILADIGIFYFIIPLVVLIIGGFFVYFKKKWFITACKKLKFNQALFFVFLIAVLIIYIKLVPSLIAPFYLTRYTLFGLPFAFMFVAWGISKLKPKTFQFLIIVAILIVSSFSLHIYYSETSKEQWREAGEFVSQQVKDNEIILFQGLIQRPFNYYLDKDTLQREEQQIKLEEGNDTSKIQFFATIKNDLDDSTGIWFVESHSYEDNRELYLNLLHQSYKLKFTKKFKGIDIYYFKK
jgi:uncharacterized membrane protein